MPVAIDIACCVHPDAALVTALFPIDGKPAATRRDIGQLDRQATGLAVNDVAAAPIDPSRRIRVTHAQDQVCKAVAIDVTCSSDGTTELIAGVPTDDAQTGTHRQQRQIDGTVAIAIERRERCTTEDYISLTFVSRRPVLGKVCADDKIIKAVAVDVTGGGDGHARGVERIPAGQAHAIGSGEILQVYDAAGP